MVVNQPPRSLYAAVDVELNGSGGGSLLGGGVTAFALVLVDDSIKVTSTTLANGTEVVLTTQLAVIGMGRGDVNLSITGKRPGRRPIPQCNGFPTVVPPSY